jgi:hypothetical protein
MSGGRQGGSHRAGDAAIEQNFHTPELCTAGSTRSWPTSRRA